MNESGDLRNAYFDKIAYGLNAQAKYQKQLAQSPAMRRYIGAIERNMAVMREALAGDDFASLLAVERAIQKVEAERFAHDGGMTASIQKTQQDLAEGMKEYRQLTETPEAYLARGYRERDRTGRDRAFPLDTMRKTLRGQAARVGNFAKNPMLLPAEKEFHLLRVSLLRRAEKLYEKLQARMLAAYGDEFPDNPSRGRQP